MKLTGRTDIGCRYKQNQDRFKAGRLSDDTYFAILCDGMGGTSKGAEASEIAVDYIEQQLVSKLADITEPEDVEEFLFTTLEGGNKKIYELGQSENITMGTTAILLIVRNNMAQFVHAGDSRVYLVAKNKIRQLTKDHSMVQDLIDTGRITEEQAQNHPNKNIITSALGVDFNLRVDYNEIKLKNSDILLLCSDGLSNMVSDEELGDIIIENEFYSTADLLIEKAIIRGGLDNITAVLVSL